MLCVGLCSAHFCTLCISALQDTGGGATCQGGGEGEQGHEGVFPHPQRGLCHDQLYIKVLSLHSAGSDMLFCYMCSSTVTAVMSSPGDSQWAGQPVQPGHHAHH